jgi:hypothetical protein
MKLPTSTLKFDLSANRPVCSAGFSPSVEHGASPDATGQPKGWTTDITVHGMGWTRASAGFTLVEIAISVAVIAFALVAIVGLLPLGMETQRDNRQETIINHDGTFLLEAIRAGAANLDDLPRFVDSVNGLALPNGSTGADVVRALSVVNSTNTAIMRAISGAASVRSSAMKEFAMHYKVVAQVFPASIDPASNYSPDLARNLYEVRLALYWPVVLATGVVPDGAHRQVFRTVVSGTVDTNGFLNTSTFVKQ